MAKEKENQNRYFPHDYDALGDAKFTAMNYFLRRVKENNLESFIDKSLLPYAAYGLYWRIIEHLHKHSFSVENLCFVADEWRIDEEFLKLILEKFNLFEIQDGFYISQRVLKNLDEQKKRKQKAQQMAKARWNNDKESKQRTEEEKTADNQAEAKMRKDGYSQLFVEFCNDLEEFRTIRSAHQLEAIEYYKAQLAKIPSTKNSKTTAKNMMLEFIKGGFKDAQEE